MALIQPDEISSIIKSKIENYELQTEIANTGTVLEVGDGIARIYGLGNVMANELVQFDDGSDTLGIAMNLEENNVGVVILGDYLNIKEGTVVKTTGRIASVPVGEGSMAAIIGLDDATIIDACEKASEVGEVQAVNFNCPGQIVIAGKVRGVEKAVEILKTAGAKKSVILPVSAPFHSNLMKPAAIKLSAELDKISISNADFPVASNFTGNLQNSAQEIKENLVAQADNPVKWIDCVNSMKNFGADIFVECGPGKTLSNFNKRIDKKLKNFNAENSDSLKKTSDALKV